MVWIPLQLLRGCAKEGPYPMRIQPTWVSLMRMTLKTSLGAQKGPDYEACTAPYGPAHGSNVLSVATDPSSLIAYAAWEDGKGYGTAAGNWKPAGCAAYLQIDLKDWF